MFFQLHHAISFFVVEEGKKNLRLSIAIPQR
jgi:hypothetical protein